MTDDFRGAAGSYGPSPAGAEPTAHPPVHSEPSQPQDPTSFGASTDPPTSSAAPTPDDPNGFGASTSSAAPTPNDPNNFGEPADADRHYPDHSSQISATPVSGSLDPYGLEPDPYGLEPDPWDTRFSPGGAARLGPRLGPRIEPSPPPDRRRIILGIVAGLACGLVLFGAGGFVAGRLTADPQAAPPAAPTPSTATGGLPIYEQSQLAINQPKFPASLFPVAQGWLPYLSGCARSGDSGGPALNEGEKVRVRCTLDGMSAIFVEYNTVADRDKARVKALGENVDARSLTPGVAAAADQVSPSGRTNGNYVEYAYKLTEGRAVRTVAGVRWDDARTPVAGYLLAYWTDGLGSSWAPIRDLWARYA